VTENSVHKHFVTVTFSVISREILTLLGQCVYRKSTYVGISHYFNTKNVYIHSFLIILFYFCYTCGDHHAIYWIFKYIRGVCQIKCVGLNNSKDTAYTKKFKSIPKSYVHLQPLFFWWVDQLIKGFPVRPAWKTVVPRTPSQYL